jgi:hypothetical protein
MRKKNGAEYAVAKWEQNRRQGMLYQGEPRHMMLKTCKIKHMYENMQKQRENNHRSQQAGQHVALAERERRGSERKQGRDDKRRQTIAYGEQGETGPRNFRRPPAQGACGRRGRAGDAAQRGSRVTHGVDSRSHYSRAMWEDR